MFSIEFPILAFSHCRDVVAAVSKAGGLGVLGVVAHTNDALETDIQWIKEEIGDKPFGIDLIVPAKYAGDDKGGYSLDEVRQLIPETHTDFLNELLERYDVPPMPAADSTNDAGRSDAAMFSASRATEQLDIALAHEPALVANALGPPPPVLIESAHAVGAKVAALAGRAVHAERHVAAGVDLVIAQGYEAGGHTGEIGSMVLIPEVVDAIAPVPVVGAGGIGRGRQMAAAMALGAAGVWCGSVWLTTEEAETHPVVKEKMLTATSSDTLRSRSLTGKPARMLRSAWTDEWAREDTVDPLGMPLQSLLTARYQQRIDRAAHSDGSGAERLANYFVGQVVGSMNKSKPAARVVLEIIDEFIDACATIQTTLGD